MSPARRTGGPSQYDRDRAVRLADIAREHGHDLATPAGWRAAIDQFNTEQNAIGGWTIRPPAKPLQALALEARAAMCDHGLRPEDCHGHVHHVWEDSHERAASP